MRIVVAPDKFKGTLTGPEAARAMAAGARSADPGAVIVVVPAADGGEGTLAALLESVGGRVRAFRARGPLGDEVAAPVAFLQDGRAVVESATVCGLGLTAAPDPLSASSFGVGELIGRARAEEPDAAIVVGVGGTASTDGGTGAGRALGWRFVDRDGHELPSGGAALDRLHAIDGTAVEGSLLRHPITAACDVSNVLTGEHGSARVFGPQKGASARQVEMLERGLERLALVVERDLGIVIADTAFGGAGGGLGAGLASFFGAQLRSGFDTVAAATGLASEIGRADVVVTGEGRFDESSSGGKVVSGVVRLARAAGARCIVVAGKCDRNTVPSDWYEDVSLVSLAEQFGERARSDAAGCITEVVAEAIRT